MVGVGLTTPPVATTLPSTMNRLGTSQLWFHLLTTERLGVGAHPAGADHVPCRGAVHAVFVAVVSRLVVKGAGRFGDVFHAVEHKVHHSPVVLAGLVEQLRGR